MMYVLLGCQLILAVVLCLAAISKLLYPQVFIRAIRISAVPKFLVYPIAISIIIVELELALGLIFSTTWLLPMAFVGTFLLLGIFTFWLILAYRRDSSIKCGCFGGSNTPVNKQSIVRNIIFMGLSLLGFFSTHLSSSILPYLSLWTLVVGIVLAGCAMLLLLIHRTATLEISNSIPTSTVAKA